MTQRHRMPLLRRPRRFSQLGVVALCLFICPASILATGTTASAQPVPSPLAPFGPIVPSNTYPSQQYYLALELYRSGDLTTAIEAFDAALGQGRIDGQGRWIDSIPALAMLAECHWHLGNLPMAMSNVDAALQLTIQHRGWLSRTDFTASSIDAIRTPDSRSGWASGSNLNVLPLSNRIPVQRGEPITEQRIAQGGTIEPLSVVSIDAIEIMRGIAIALHRRRIIMGELSREPTIPAQVLEATKYPQDLQSPVGRTLIAALRSIGRYADLDDARVIAEAPPAAMLQGGIHPLTPLVLLCHAETVAASDKPGEALTLAIQSARAAAALGQYEWVTEALQLAVGCASDPVGLNNVADLATGAAGSYRRHAEATALASLLVAAEARARTGAIEPAATLVEQARLLTTQRRFNQPRIAAYGAYVTSLVLAAQGQTLEGSTSTTIANAFGSLRSFTFDRRIRNQNTPSNPSLYQLQLTLAANGRSLGGKRSEELLKRFAGDPPDAIWRRDPVESIGWLMHNRTSVRAALLTAAASSQDPKQILIQTDTLLRQAFAGELLLSGRLQNIRTLASVDPNRVGPEVAELFKQPPVALGALRQAGLAIAKPGAPAATAESVRQLEALAAQATLSRRNYPSVMLPAFQIEDMRRLPPRTGLVVFTIVGNRIIATFAHGNTFVTWSVGELNPVSSAIGKLLKEIGVGPGRGAKIAADSSWRSQAAELRRQILSDQSIAPEQFDELVIVPAGPLWYLPFELLPTGGENAALLSEKIRIRYAPTPGLAVQPAPLAQLPFAGQAEVGATAIGAQPFFAPRDLAANEAFVESIADAAGESVRLPLTPATPTGWLPSNVTRLLIAAARPIDPTRSLAFAPLEQDAMTFEGTLGGWLALPNQAPTSVLLPGFRTPLAAGKLGDGSELFMTLTALHAAGVRDVLLSRWAVGGQSTALVLRETIQEMPHSGLLAAWQRALLLLRTTPLDPATEPLLTSGDRDTENLTGAEPLFWSSYLIATPSIVSP